MQIQIDIDFHHSNGDLMILFIDYKHYRTIVPCFLLDSIICKEAEYVENDSYCCVAIPKKINSIGKFLYEEMRVPRRHMNVYKSGLYLICDVLRLEKTRHDDNVTLPQLMRAII